MTAKPKPIPDGFHAVTPYLVVEDTATALDFYSRVFGAKELFRMPGPGGKIAHAEMQIGDSRILLSDEFPERGEAGGQSPRRLRGSPVSLLIYAEDVDTLYERAIGAGATPKTPPTNMFWGDRWSQLVDPFGHEWQIATHVEDVTPQEMGKRAAAMINTEQAQ